MAYITSRNFAMPETADEMSDGFWFNLWTRRLWPYHELTSGDLLYWYESPSKIVTWKTEVRQVDQFEYAEKVEASDRLYSVFKGFDQLQPYFVNGPDSGYCVAWNVTPIERVELPRPDDFRFSQNGWMKVSEVAKLWPELET